MKNTDSNFWSVLAVLGLGVLAVLYFRKDEKPIAQSPPDEPPLAQVSKPEPPTRWEFKYTENGKSYKYWADSTGATGGDLTWVIPLPNFKVDVNIYKGSVAVSSTKLPFFKLGAELGGDIKVSFTPQLKSGPFSVGMNMEIASFNMRDQLGVAPIPRTSLYAGLDPTKPTRSLFDPITPNAMGNLANPFEMPHANPFQTPPVKPSTIIDLNNPLNPQKPKPQLVDLSKPSYSLNVTLDPTSPLGQPIYQYDIYTGKFTTRLARLRLSSEQGLSVRGDNKNASNDYKQLWRTPSGKLEVLPFTMEDPAPQQPPIGLKKLLDEIKPLQPEEVDLSELFKTLPAKK